MESVNQLPELTGAAVTTTGGVTLITGAGTTGGVALAGVETDTCGVRVSTNPAPEFDPSIFGFGVMIGSAERRVTAAPDVGSPALPRPERLRYISDALPSTSGA